MRDRPPWRPGDDVAGHLVLEVVYERGERVLARGRDPHGSAPGDVAISRRPGRPADAVRARQRCQRLAATGHPALAVPTWLGVVDAGLVRVRPWAATTFDELGCVDARRWVTLLAPLARGLAAAHHVATAHGAVKPSNVVVTSDGRGRLVDPATDGTTPIDDVVALAEIGLSLLDPSAGLRLADRLRRVLAVAAAGQLSADSLGDALDALAAPDPPATPVGAIEQPGPDAEPTRRRRLTRRRTLSRRR